MKQRDFSLFKSNVFLSQAVSKESLNFCRFITTGLKNNISVVAKYNPTLLSDYFVTLDKDLHCVFENDFTDYYYGVAPQIDSALIIDSISRLEFSSLEGVDAFISAHSRCFMLHSSQKEHLLNLARYIIIAYASNYGIKIHASAECLAAATTADPTGKIITIDNDVLKIHGCPTPEILAAFSAIKFTEGNDSTWQAVADGGIYLKQIYKTADNIVLLNGSTFYSGVLLKPLMFSFLKNCYENYNTATLSIDFERTTYATVFALDGNFLYHPLLKCCKNAISDILYYDDACKLRMVEALDKVQAADESAESLLVPINMYLEQCINVNQIGISGNIVTSDNTLLLGKRSGNSIDSGFLYPGTNGNAEISDPNVSFYSYSVYADAPSILLDDRRIDFHGEITREAYAELRQDVRQEDWICYGVTVSGNVSYNKQPTKALYENTSRRLHFNVLFEQSIEEDFSSVCKTARSAVESFENERILGVEVSSYKDFTDYAVKLCSRFFERIAESKDLVESLLLLTLFFNATMRQHIIAVEDWSSTVSLTLALVIVAVTLHRCCRAVVKSIRRQHLIRHILIFRNNPYEIMQRKIYKSVSSYHYHPVAFAALQLYVENKVFDEMRDDSI